MASVTLDESVRTTWKDMRKNGNYDYSIFTVQNSSGLKVTLERSVKSTEPSDADRFEEFVESLPEAECRYAVYDFRYMSRDESEVNNFLLIIWCPEEANVDEKDMYHAARNAIRSEMIGLKSEHLISHPDELNFSEIQAAYSS